MAAKTPPVWCADIVLSVLPCVPLSVAVPGEDHSYPGKNDLWDADAGTIRLSGASHEVLSFQLIVEKKAGIVESISLSSGDVSPELELFAGISGEVNEQWCDDALCPLDPPRAGEVTRGIAKLLRAKGRKRQVYIIELYLPRGTKPGSHSLSLDISLSKAGSVSLNVDLTVYDFELPAEPYCTADMNAYGTSLARGWKGLDAMSDRYLDIEKKFFRMVHDHLGLLHELPYAHSGRLIEGCAPVLEGKGGTRRVKDWTPFDRHWSPYLDGSAFEGTRRGPTPISYLYTPINLNWPAYFEKYGSVGFETEFKNVTREFAVHFAEKGWTKTKFEVFFNHKARYKYFPWDMDEIRFERDNEATLYLARLAREAVDGIEGPQFVNRIDSSWIFSKSVACELADNIELWVVNGSYLAPFPDEAARLREKGQEIWFYGGAGGIAGSNRYHNLRWPWMAWGRDVNGFTYWNAFGWPGEFWKTLSRGGAHIMYPGEPAGLDAPLSSIRMKTMMRGMQDNMYLNLLTERTGSRDAAYGIIQEHLGNTREREDWWQRGEYPGASGSEIRASKFSSRPWHETTRTDWNNAREALGKALEGA